MHLLVHCTNLNTDTIIHTFYFPIAGETKQVHQFWDITWLARPNLLFNWTLSDLPDSPKTCPSWIWVALSLNSEVLMSPCLRSWILLAATTKKPHVYGVSHHVNPHFISSAPKHSEAHTLYRCQIFLLFQVFTHALETPLHSLTQHVWTIPHKTRTHACTHTHISKTGGIIPRGNILKKKSTCFSTQ
jgi:hypothetical protein